MYLNDNCSLHLEYAIYYIKYIFIYISDFQKNKSKFSIEYLEHYASKADKGENYCFFFYYFLTYWSTMVFIRYLIVYYIETVLI